MTLSAFLIIMLVVLASSLVVGIGGLAFAYLIRPRPELRDDPYVNVHGELPTMPWAAQRCATERLDHSLAPSSDRTASEQHGRMYAMPPRVRASSLMRMPQAARTFFRRAL